jgi:hypothetical protein
MGWSRENHKDGSYTDRHDDNYSETRDADDNLIEKSYVETTLPGIGIGPNLRTTEDGDGNVINVQWDYDSAKPK